MRIAILGKNFSGLTEYLKRHSADYVIFSEKSRPAIPEPHTIYCDYSSLEEVLKTIENEHSLNPFFAVTTSWERHIVLCAEVSSRLGLPGMPVKSAIAATDKSVMRTLFANAPSKISPDFRKVESEKDLHDFANAHTFPLILKPINLAKSLLVTKNDSLEQLLGNYAKACQEIDRVYAKHAPNNQRQMLVEEYLDGSVHSVDAFVNSDGEPTVLPHIVDYETGYDIGFDDNFHYSRTLPSKLDTSTQSKVIKTAELGIQALGMKNTAAHVEVIVTIEGPRIVEIGARNGGYRERMHRLAQGIDIYGCLLDTLQKKSPKTTATKNEPCTVFELFPKNPGDFIGIAHEEELRKLPSLKYMSITVKHGVHIGLSSEGYKAACILLLHNKNQKQFEEDIEFVNNKVSVLTSNIQTTQI